MKKRRTVFYRNKYFWVALIIVALILYILSTVISGRRAKMTNHLNSMPAIEQHTDAPDYGLNIDIQ